MYYIRQKNGILVVAMQKISLATIFIRKVNNFILISDFKYELNQTSISYKKISIRFCCFCSTATVAYCLWPIREDKSAISLLPEIICDVFLQAFVPNSSFQYSKICYLYLLSLVFYKFWVSNTKIVMKYYQYYLSITLLAAELDFC